MTTLSKELPIDFFKMLNEWALAAGRHLQSKQTGYVHYYEGEAQQGFQTIPLLENALFVLALLRSRLIEQIQEAKVLLKGLLAFQNLNRKESYGNFPVYLHTYPICSDSALGLRLLAPFYWMIKQFGHVLGSELKQQLEQAVRLILDDSFVTHQLKPFPYSIAIRLATAQWAYGSLWSHLEWQQEGQKQVEELAKQQLEGWHTTTHLADLLVGLQMVYPSILNSPWKPLWQYMQQTWHYPTGCYVGPCVREWQEQEEPQPTLYDLYSGYFAGQFSRRATLLRPYHLHGILIQPSSDKFDVYQEPFVVEGQLKQQAWQIVYHPLGVYTLLEKKEPLHPSIDKTYTPFRLIWGDQQRVHSLVCQGGHYDKVNYVNENHSIQLIFELRDMPQGEERYPQREIEFFVDYHPDLLFTLGDHLTNTFELGQKLVLTSGKHRLALTVDLLEGEGNFLGHVMRDNRPSQLNDKKEKKFQAYDWTFFLRTIRRQSCCRLQATFSFEAML